MSYKQCSFCAYEERFKSDKHALVNFLKTKELFQKTLFDSLRCTYAIHNIVKVCVVGGYDVNTTDEEGVTALHVACENFHVSAVKSLLKYGAIYSANTLSLQMPIHNLVNELTKCCWTLRRERNEFNRYHVDMVIRELRAKAYSILRQLVYYGFCLDATIYIHREIVKKFMSDATTQMLLLFAESGYDLTYVDFTDGCRTLLHDAAWHGNVQAVKELCYRTDINAKSDEGTPLHLAASRGWFQCVHKLVKSGCHVETTDSPTGYTPLYQALRSRKRGSAKVLEYLIMNRSGVNSHLSNNNALLDFLRAEDAEDFEYIDSRKLIALALHMIKMKTANYLISEDIIAKLELNEDVRRHLTEKGIKSACVSEIDRLREFKFFGDMTMYEFMKKHETFTCWYINQRVTDYFKSSTLELEFPMYWDSLIIAFKNASKRRNLVETSEHNFSVLLSPYNVPYPAMRAIINYLSNDDLYSVTNI